MVMKVRILLIIFFFFHSYFVNSGIDIPAGFGVPFDKGMYGYADRYNSEKASEDENWQLAKQLYKTYIIDNLEFVEQPRIPKIIHQIWVGPHPFPNKCKVLQKTWKKHHPDWKYKLWTDADVKELDLINEAAYEKAKNYGQKSDILRYEILYKYGGLYVDTDFECFRAFDIFHHCLDFYTGIAGLSNKGAFGLINALIGCAPGHPIIKACIETMNISDKPHSSWIFNIMHTTGPAHLVRCFLKEALHGERSVAFPCGYFYPWPHHHKRQNRRHQILKWKRPETFAIHHWHCSWIHRRSIYEGQDIFDFLFEKFYQDTV